MTDDSHIHIDMSHRLKSDMFEGNFIDKYNAMITCYYHPEIWDKIGRPKFRQPISIGMMFEENMKR